MGLVLLDPRALPSLIRHSMPSNTPIPPAASVRKWRAAIFELSPTKQAFIIGGIIISLLAVKKTDAFTNPQFWAEDGRVFFAQAKLQGWASLHAAYAGYLHTWLRLIANCADVLPAGWIPAAYNYASALGTALVAVRLFSPRVNLPGKPWLALALVLVPHTGEVMVTLTNLQWITAFLLIIQLMMDDAKTRWTQTGDILILALTGITGPFSLILLPLFGWRYLQDRSRGRLVNLVVIAFTSAIQLGCVYRSNPLTQTAAPFDLQHYLPILSRRLIVADFYPVQLSRHFSALTLNLIGVAAVALLIGVAANKSNLRSQKWMLGYIIIALIATSSFKARLDRLDTDDFYNADRYFYIPKILVLWILVMEWRAPRWRWACLALLTISLLASLYNFRSPPLIDQKWNDYAKSIDAGLPVKAPINPPGWFVELPARPLIPLSDNQP